MRKVMWSLMGCLALLAAHGARADAAGTALRTPLATDGARIVDADGRTAVLQGVNWFGFETSNHVVHGLWTRDYRDVLVQIRQLGFNSIRLPFSLEALEARSVSGVDFSSGRNAALRGRTPLQAMDVVIDEAARQGLVILLDNHSAPDDGYTDPLWYGRGYAEDDWVEAWRGLAARYADRPNVIGADLKNEPHGAATWGTGGATDWRRAAQRAGNAVLAEAPHWLIVVEGIEGKVEGQRLDRHWWGGNLEGVRRHPVRLARTGRLVYSPHEYGPGVFPQPWFSDPRMASILEDRWQKGFGYLLDEKIAPVLVGEFGGRRVDQSSTEGRWQRQFFDFLGRRGISWTYWALNPNSGDTGGILADDWTKVDAPKVALLQQLIRRRRIESGAANPQAPAPPAPQPAPRPEPPVLGPPAPPPPAVRALQARFVVENRWDGGSCGHLEVAAPSPTKLGGARVAFRLPAGTRIAQSWNAELSGATGRVSATLPAWAKSEAGAAYAATGFCLEGAGAPTELSVG